MCDECDKRIHNKGKRINHIRDNILTGIKSERGIAS